jgi:hypothetical protein
MGSIPRDPFTGSNETWTVQTTPAPPFPRAGGVRAGSYQGGEYEGASVTVDSAGAGPGIVDVHSGSDAISLEGTPYSSW